MFIKVAIDWVTAHFQTHQKMLLSEPECEPVAPWRSRSNVPLLLSNNLKPSVCIFLDPDSEIFRVTIEMCLVLSRLLDHLPHIWGNPLLKIICLEFQWPIYTATQVTSWNLVRVISCISLQYFSTSCAENVPNSCVLTSVLKIWHVLTIRTGYWLSGQEDHYFFTTFACAEVRWPRSALGCFA